MAQVTTTLRAPAMTLLTTRPDSFAERFRNSAVHDCCSTGLAPSRGARVCPCFLTSARGSGPSRWSCC